MHGYGTHTWPDGREYKGEYSNDKKHGKGIFKWPDGKIYDGMWSNGVQDGEGKLIKPDGSYKIGLFKDGALIKVIKSYNKNGIEEREESRNKKSHKNY